MELPVVATVEIQGERVVVRAAPLSLVARLAQGPDDAATMPVISEILARCCSLEGGGPVDQDALSMNNAQRLLRIAVKEEGDADFRPPPASREPAG